MCQASPCPTQRKIIDAALSLVCHMQWNNITHQAIADEAGCTLGEVTALFPNLVDIIAPIVAEIDTKLSEQFKLDPHSEGREDSLFDAFMSRFEIMQEKRESLIALGSEGRKTPELALAFYKAQIKSAENTWSLIEPTDKDANPIEKHALLLIFQYAFIAWEHDTTPDLAATMAALDTAIKKAKWLNIFAAQ